VEKEIVDRWKSSEYVDSVKKYISEIINERKNTTACDLRGIKIGIEGPLKDLWNANLDSVNIFDVDFSYSTIAGSLAEGLFKNVNFSAAFIDRGVLFKAHFNNCNFTKAKLIVKMDDAVCENCDFTDSEFKGGKSSREYGGRRVKFLNCNFSGTGFKGVEFRATKFINCNFSGTAFENSDFRGAKFEEIIPSENQFKKCEMPKLESD